MAEVQMTLAEAITLMYEVRLGDRHSDALAKVLRVAEAVSEAATAGVGYDKSDGYFVLTDAGRDALYEHRNAMVRIVREDVL